MPNSLSDLADNLSEINKKECKAFIERKILNQNAILSILKMINLNYIICVKNGEKDALSQ